MGKHENIISVDPPATTAKAVKAHRRVLEQSKDGLKADAAALALRSARGDTDARDALAALHQKIQAIEFEIEQNYAAVELADKEDAAALVAWLASIQTLSPTEAVAGVGKDACCGRCLRGVPNGCVLAAGTGSADCWHPIKQRDSFYRESATQHIFPFRHFPQAARAFDAACEALKLKGRFA